MKKRIFKSFAELPVAVHPREGYFPISQKLLEEALAGQPALPLTPEDINRLAAIDEEKYTEGRIDRRPDRINPHD